MQYCTGFSTEKLSKIGGFHNIFEIYAPLQNPGSAPDKRDVNKLPLPIIGAVYDTFREVICTFLDIFGSQTRHNLNNFGLHKMFKYPLPRKTKCTRVASLGDVPTLHRQREIVA